MRNCPAPISASTGSRAAVSDASELVDTVFNLARGYVRGAGVVVSVKTNYGPELALFRAALARSSEGQGEGSGGGLGSLVGLKAAVIVRDGHGATLATYGDPPATEPLRALAAALLAGGVIFLILRGALKR